MQKRKKYIKNQMYALIRKWEASGQTQECFFNQHGISKSTFGYWRKKFLREQGSQSKSHEKFIPVKITGEHTTNPRQGVLELVYPNGVRIVCSADMDLVRLKPLILL
jgi:hypothetical protein